MRFDQFTISYEHLDHLKKNPDLFKQRANQLKQLKSNHIITINTILPSMKIKYQACQKHNLGAIINQKHQFLPSQIKTIIWQITKAMLQCQKRKINHLKLYPKSINLLNKPSKQENLDIFVKICNFSFGKQFDDVSSGKILDYFQYLHPDLSIRNNPFSFDQYNASWDIWSLGIILYYLIYHQNPFRKKNSDKYSKTILREYLKQQYQILYPIKRFKSLNNFIQRCLNVQGMNKGFSNWQQIKLYIIEQQQMYTTIDFYDGDFTYMIQLHIKLMTLFSSIYCLITQELQYNPNHFWKINNKESSLHLKLQESALILMNYVNNRFHTMYSSYFHLVEDRRIELLQISKCIAHELEYKGNRWIEDSFNAIQLNLKMINIIDDICLSMKNQVNNYGIIQEYKESQFEYDVFNSDILPASYKYREKQIEDSQIITSMQIIFDYCKEMNEVIDSSKTRIKKIQENLYNNRILQYLVQNKFHSFK